MANNNLQDRGGPILPESVRRLDVVLSHDWLTGMRGGERVLEILCRTFPEAPLLTLLHNPSSVSEIIRNRNVVTSWLQNVPGIAEHYRLFLPLFPAAVNRLSPPPAELLISTSHCVAKAVRRPPGGRHLCYCFTPMRYAWVFYEEYFGRNPLKGLFVRPVRACLRAWDRNVSNRVDRFVAISRTVQRRIREYYGRESDVVYPPVDTKKWTPNESAAETFRGRDRGAFDLIVSALVPYKKVELAVRAYARSGFPLTIIGIGGEMAKLRRIAPANVTLLGWQDDESVLRAYRTCRMLLFPGEEDFGLVPVEAQACGCPVVAYSRGGATETVVPEISGVLFDEQTEDSLLAAVEECAAREWRTAAIRENAERFKTETFLSDFAGAIGRCLEQE